MGCGSVKPPGRRNGLQPRRSSVCSLVTVLAVNLIKHTWRSARRPSPPTTLSLITLSGCAVSTISLCCHHSPRLPTQPHGVRSASVLPSPTAQSRSALLQHHILLQSVRTTLIS